MSAWITDLGQALVLATLVVCAYTDVRWRRIPNAFLLVGLLAAALAEGARGPTVLAMHALAGLMVLTLGLAAWLFGTVGAGDAKLFGVAGVLLGMDRLVGAFVVFALLSGLWAFALAVRAAIARDPERIPHIVFGVPLYLPQKVTLPLAVPMAAGVVLMVALTHLHA